MEAKDVIELLKAFATLAWPLLVAVVIACLFPTIVSLARSRSFSLEIAGMKVSVQDATQTLQSQIEDLQHQVIALREQSAPPPVAGAPQAVAAPVAPPPRAAGARVLWVDDNMSNNAFQIAQLRDQGVTVVQSGATEDAMSILHSSPPFEAVISDMGRREAGRYDSRAGLSLLQRMRAEGVATPFIVYTTQDYAQRTAEAVRAGGGDGATGSAVELLEWVRRRIAAAPAQPA